MTVTRDMRGSFLCVTKASKRLLVQEPDPKCFVMGGHCMSSVLRETWRFQKNVPGLTSDCGIDTSLPALGSQSWPLCACLSITQPQGRDLRTQAQRQCCERLDTEVLRSPSYQNCHSGEPGTTKFHHPGWETHMGAPVSSSV